MFWSGLCQPPKCADATRRSAEIETLIFPSFWSSRISFGITPELPELTPSSFFRWRNVKEVMYQTHPQALNELENRIRHWFHSVDERLCGDVCSRVDKMNSSVSMKMADFWKLTLKVEVYIFKQLISQIYKYHSTRKMDTNTLTIISYV